MHVCASDSVHYAAAAVPLTSCLLWKSLRHACMNYIVLRKQHSEEASALSVCSSHIAATCKCKAWANPGNTSDAPWICFIVHSNAKCESDFW